MSRFYRCNILILAVVALAAPRVAFADAVSDGQTVASKLYVDNVTENMEVTTNKLDGGSGNTITANSSNTTKYPSAKAVADYAVKIAQGVGPSNANVGKTLVVNSSGNLELSEETIASAISAVDISAHTVNGAPLSNTASYYYGTSSTAADTVQKEVSIPSITSLQAGQIIAVKPTITSTVAASTIKLNNFTAYPMRYRNAAITTSTDELVWYANTVSFFLFDGSYWHFVAGGSDNTNTTYAAMRVEEGIAGEERIERTVRADYLKDIIQGTTLTGLDTTRLGPVAAKDSITMGIGKLEATKQPKPQSVANGQFLTYTGSDANRDVSAAYIKVPTATGDPNASGTTAPTEFSSIWIQSM